MSSGYKGSLNTQANKIGSAKLIHSLGKSSSLYSKNNAVASSNTNGCASSSHSFHGVFYLKQMPIGWKDGNGAIVTHDVLSWSEMELCLSEWDVIGEIFLGLFVKMVFFRRKKKMKDVSNEIIQ